MPLSPGQWQKALTADVLQPVYLLAGEQLLVLEAADALRAQARKLGYSEREVLEVGQHFDWNDLARSAAGMSLFATRRLIDLRLPTGKPGKEGGAAIEAYCDSAPPDTVLLIVANEWSKRHEGAWTQAVDAIGAVVPVWPLKPDELPHWIGQRMAARGLAATPEAVEALVERTEGNLLAAAQEIDKLALLSNGEVLDAERMESLVANAARYDVFRLTDAVLAGQGAQVSRILVGLRAEGDMVAGLMPMVVKELLRTAALARVQAGGGNLAAEMKAQGIWEAKQAPFKRALQRHASPARWDRFVAEASKIDRTAKGRGEGDAWVALERLLLAIADAKAVRLLVA